MIDLSKTAALREQVVIVLNLSGTPRPRAYELVDMYSAAIRSDLLNQLALDGIITWDVAAKITKGTIFDEQTFSN